MSGLSQPSLDPIENDDFLAHIVTGMREWLESLGWPEFYLGRIRIVLDDAFEFAASLDALAGSTDTLTTYVHDLHATLLERGEAWMAVANYARLPAFDGNTLRETAKLSTPEQRANSLLMHHFREALRDGRSPSQVMIKFASMISSKLGAGDVDFLIRLANVIKDHQREPFQRLSIEGWVTRAWIPLRLWECAGRHGQEAERRLRRAWDLDQMSQRTLKWKDKAHAVHEDFPDSYRIDKVMRDIRAKITNAGR